MKRFLASSLLSVAALASMASTAGAITYQYTGNPFETVFAPYTTSMSVDMTITLSTPLPSNATDIDALPLITALIAFDGVQILTEGSTFVFASFVVSTDAAGLPTAWAAEFHTTVNTGIVTCGSTGGLSLVAPSICLVAGFDTDIGDTGIIEPYGEVDNNPGVWTLVPEPNTALLLAMGLAGLGWRGRVRRS